MTTTLSGVVLWVPSALTCKDDLGAIRRFGGWFAIGVIPHPGGVVRIAKQFVEQWRNIRRLYLAGADLRDICRQLGISARTVYRYKDLQEPPPRPAYKRRASVLDPYVPYLLKRWNEG